jgi:hypothetical protein
VRSTGVRRRSRCASQAVIPPGHELVFMSSHDAQVLEYGAWYVCVFIAALPEYGVWYVCACVHRCLASSTQFVRRYNKFKGLIVNEQRRAIQLGANAPVIVAVGTLARRHVRASTPTALRLQARHRTKRWTTRALRSSTATTCTTATSAPVSMEKRSSAHWLTSVEW